MSPVRQAGPLTLVLGHTLLALIKFGPLFFLTVVLLVTVPPLAIVPPAVVIYLALRRNR